MKAEGTMASLLARGCRVLREPGVEALEADVLVEDGVLRLVEPGKARGEGGLVLDCDEDTVVVPCLFSAWTMPLRLGDGVCHRELVEILGGELEGVPFSIEAVKLLASRAASLGLCGIVVSVPPHYDAEELREVAESASAKVLFNVVADAEGRHLGEAVSLLEKLKSLGLAAGLEILNSSLASRDVLLKAREAAARLKLKLYLHTSYAKREVYESKKRWGVFPVERLYRLGILDRDTVLVGASWISSWELGYVAEKGSPIVYAPAHDMLHCLGGHFPLHEALGSRVVVWFGLGFTTASPDPLRLLWAGMLLQRYVYWDRRVAAVHLLKTAVMPAELFSAPASLEDGGRAWLEVYRLDPSSRTLGLGVEYGLLRMATLLAAVVDGRLVYKGFTNILT